MTLHVCKHSNLLCSVIFVNFCNYFFQQWRHYVVACQLSAQEIVKWVTTADGCVHTADTTQLDSFVTSASAVCIGHKPNTSLAGLESWRLTTILNSSTKFQRSVTPPKPVFTVSQTVQTYFLSELCHIWPIVKFFSTKIAERTSFSKVYSFSTSPNLC